jgi:hypothetical protein
MATYVECGQTRILIDPGAALGPKRYNLPPADEEWEALRRANDRIAGYATRAEMISVSHYHHDHFVYEPGIYATRTVWAKDPTRMVNPSQARRAQQFWAGVKAGCRLESAEGRVYDFPDTVVKASPPLSHGVEGSSLGYVVALTVVEKAEGFRFVHASDVQGPISPVATAYLIREKPHLIYLSGPPSYLEGQIGTQTVEQGIDNLLRIVETTGCRVIMDHYALRDLRQEERFRRLWETGRVVTAAGYLGLSNELLEANRNLLWSRRRKPEAKMEQPRLNAGAASDILGHRTVLKRVKGGKRR